MEKMNFVYIGKNLRFNQQLPKGEFKAILVNIEKYGKKMYVPLYSRYGDNVEKEGVFIYGVGNIKVGKRKQYDIPVFDGSVEGFNEYIEKYGTFCMQYSIEGDLFMGNQDCCVYSKQCEYSALLHYGAETFNRFSTIVSRMIELQRSILIEKYMPLFDLKTDDYHSEWYMCENFQFNPEYMIGGGIFGCPVLLLDTPADDEKMEKLYRKIRYKELFKQHELYNECAGKKAEVDSYLQKRGGKCPSYYWSPADEYDEYERLIIPLRDIRNKIDNDVDAQIKSELENGCEQFPVQMKARIEKLFGPEVMELYEQALNLKTDEPDNE